MISFHQFEQAGWQRAAEHYGDRFGGLTTQAVAPLLDAIGIAPRLRVLDVATGPGYVAGAAAAAGAQVIGVDFSSSMISRARQQFPAVEFREGDGQALPLADASVDAVVMNFGLLHLARPDDALAEAHRVLVPGGRFAFTVWATPGEARGFDIVLRAIDRHGRLDVPLPPGPPFFRFSDPDESRRSLEAVGFVRPAVRRVPITWRVRSGADVLDAFLLGAVRTAALLRAQTPAALEAIRRALDAQVGGGADLPMPAVLATAWRP